MDINKDTWMKNQYLWNEMPEKSCKQNMLRHDEKYKSQRNGCNDNSLSSHQPKEKQTVWIPDSWTYLLSIKHKEGQSTRQEEDLDWGNEEYLWNIWDLPVGQE